MKYDTSLTWNRLQSDPAALALVKQYLPEMEQMIKDYPNAARISIAAASRYAPQLFTPEKIDALQAALAEYGKTHGLTPEEQEKLEKYRRMASEKRPYSGLGRQPKAVAFYPGRPWPDTGGKRIQTHAGAIYYENGVYYWYGENKEFTDGKCGIWTWGIRVYRSKDLYNWEDLGLLVAPNLDDPDDNLFPEKCVDRPHILKCPKTGKYLLWLKISGAESCFTVLQADTLLGPYFVLRQNYHPLGHHVGDFDMVADEKSGIGYLYMDTDHDRIAGFRLTEDYTAVEAEISSQYEGLKTPFRREGIALFEHGEKKYMITSGMSGYTPNQSDAAVADSWEGPFVSIGDPHVDDESMASFNSQISQVFKLPGREQYIALADRWMPRHLLDGKGSDIVRRAIASKYQPDLYSATPEEKKFFSDRPDLERADTQTADYVWLPVTFADGKPQIRWHDAWRLE